MSGKQQERRASKAALQGCEAVQEFLLSDGSDRNLLDRAKSGAKAMNAYVRLRAKRSNRNAAGRERS